MVLLSQCTKSVKEPATTKSVNVKEGVGKGSITNSKRVSQTLKVTVSMQADEFALLQKQSLAYTTSHEDINVELTNVTDTYTSLKKANQLGDAPDLMLLDNHWVNEFASLGFLHPMDEFFTGEQQSQGITALMNQVKWNGYLWAIPKDVDPYIMVWNRNTALEKKWEHAPESIDELLIWNKTMMHPEEGKYGVYFDPLDSYAFLSLISALGGDRSGSHSLTKINEPITLKKIESFFVPQEETWNGAFLKQNYPPKSPSWDPWNLLQQGKMAAMVTTVSEFKRRGDNSIALAALSIKAMDSSDKSNLGLLKGRSYAISSRSKNEVLAINWIKEMTSIGTDLIVWDEAKLLPSLPTAYLTTPISNDVYSDSYIWLINNGRVLPIEPETNKKISSLKAEWNQVWNGQQSMKNFLDHTSKLWMDNKSKF
jgi:multiple sugar transport system substrate-binding protein